MSSLLSSNGVDGFVLNGIDGDDLAGISVAAAGDVNGDGFDDLIVGAFDASPGGRNRAGESYVLYGTDQGFVAQYELSSLLAANGGDGSAGFVLNGIDITDRAGWTVAHAGDVNVDGFDDVIVQAREGDPGGRNSAGESYVVFGTDQGIPAEFELSSLQLANGGDGSSGFVLNGIDPNDFSGFAADAAGDVNSDGFDDLIIGAHLADPGGRIDAGESYVVFGTDQGFAAEFELSDLQAANGGDGSAGFVLNGIDPDERAGQAVSAAGDINGDGVDDLIVGAFLADPGGRTNAGASYVVFGSDQGFAAQIELSSLLAANGGDGSDGIFLGGIDNNDYSGIAVGGAGDINGDGIDDLIIGARLADPGGRASAGESYVLFGSAQAFPAQFPLANLLVANGGDGSDGFVLKGIDNADWSGISVGAAGDVNADGFDDLIVGARFADPNGINNAGESYVLYGTDSGFAAEIELASLLAANGGNGSAGFVLNGIDDGDLSGFSGGFAGDVNGDGIDDLIVGASFGDPGGRVDGGESYIVFGRGASDDPDTDGDGVVDSADNCQQTPNADQRDSNDDGFGNVCDADLNGDCIVNTVDLGLFRLVFFTPDPDADFDGSGVVNAVDLGSLRLLFFAPPGPSGLAQCP